MKRTYFKVFGQKAPGNKILLIAAINDDLLGELPDLFTLQASLEPKTVYTGIAPTIKLDMSTVENRDDYKGMGAAGVITSLGWYCVTREISDPLGISIE